jgi:3-hydroxybutyryl-CoA dehydrogenase
MKITVIGAGIMGSGIAYSSSVAGFETTLSDVSQEVLDKASQTIHRSLDKGIQRGKLDEEGKRRALAHLELEHDMRTAVSGAELVIEAVPERIELKCTIFGELDGLTGDDVVLATNTSSLSITEIAAATNHPDRVIGMHFFNPVPKMKLVEIIRGLDTSEHAFRVVEETARAMGKETVDVRESPGFVTSRINAVIGNEAFYLLQEGVASARDIDKALKLGLNHPMGPFEMVDLVGLDTRLGVLTYLHDRLGEKYRPCPLLVQYVKAGRLGRKVDRGVYDYSEARR